MGIRKAKEKRNKKDELQKKIKEHINKKEPDNKQINEYKKELDRILNYELEGARIRSRKLLLPGEEQGSKDFFALEIKNKKTESIESLLKDNREIYKENEIKEEIFQYYKELYTSEGTDKESLQECIKTLQPIEQTDKEKEILNNFFSEKELRQSLASMSDGKTPGGDGLPREFYMHTWKFMGGDLAEVINNSFLTGRLPASLREAQIKLLHKKGDRRLLKNWRPVSLLNVDYKMLSAAIARRLTGAMTKIIAITQGCSVRGRHIFDNLRLVEDLIDRDERNMCKAFPGGLIKSLDLEKAFDRVEHQYIRAVFNKLNLGVNISKWVEILYNDISTQVMTPFGLTDKLTVTRSVRQGCPLSMALFVLVQEALMRLINNSKHIDGVKINNSTSVKILAYADDTTLLLKDKKEEAYANDLIRIYERASGAKCNEAKTQSLLFGMYRNAQGVIAQDTIELLGIHFHHEKGVRVKKNWDAAEAAMRDDLNRWTRRKMSIFGKSTIIGAFVVSRLSYVNKIIPCPQSTLGRIEKAINNFVYSTRPPGYSNLHMARPITEGGTGLPLIAQKAQAQLLMWVSHYIAKKGQGHPWTCLFEQLGRGPLQELGVMPREGPRLQRPDQSSMYGQLSFRPGFESIQWSSITNKDLYKMLIAPHVLKFGVERLHTNLDWGDIWSGLKAVNVRNDLKIILHTVITDHFRINNYKVANNKSGNCPLCDFDFVRSRDHTFFNCRGVAPLLERIKFTEGVDVTPDMLFYGKFEIKQAAILIAYAATIKALYKGQEGKWGTPPLQKKLDTFRHYRSKTK